MRHVWVGGSGLGAEVHHICIQAIRLTLSGIRTIGKKSVQLGWLHLFFSKKKHVCDIPAVDGNLGRFMAFFFLVLLPSPANADVMLLDGMIFTRSGLSYRLGRFNTWEKSPYAFVQHMSASMTCWR